MNTLNARLSFRRDSQGGDITSGKATPTNALTRFDRVVLLIHGYNNDEPDAQTAYEGFDRLQRQLSGIAEKQPVMGGRVVEVYWPGDAKWGIFSCLYYMGSIANALESAQLLAEALRSAADARGFLNVDVVAHSMGCRLTLEMLKQLAAVPNIRVGRAIFMAAAVATEMLEPEPDVHGLRHAYDHVLTDGAISLYSGHDMVLALAFPIGQTLAPGNEGFFPTALGHALWHGTKVPPQLQCQQYENRGAGHSDYWGWREETCAQQGKFANEHIQRFLHLSTPASRTIIRRCQLSRTGHSGRSTVEASKPVTRRVAD
jgi:pimeloyl-ACP methyl ester carboxylesterase